MFEYGGRLYRVFDDAALIEVWSQHAPMPDMVRRDEDGNVLDVHPQFAFGPGWVNAYHHYTADPELRTLADAAMAKYVSRRDAADREYSSAMEAYWAALSEWERKIQEYDQRPMIEKAAELIMEWEREDPKYRYPLERLLEMKFGKRLE